MVIRLVQFIGAALLILTAPVFADETSGPAEDTLPAGARARFGTARFVNLGRVFTVAFSDDGQLLAGGAWDGSIRVWQSATGKEVRRFTGHQGPVRKVVFSRDGKTLASAGKAPGLCL